MRACGRYALVAQVQAESFYRKLKEDVTYAKSHCDTEMFTFEFFAHSSADNWGEFKDNKLASLAYNSLCMCILHNNSKYEGITKWHATIDHMG